MEIVINQVMKKILLLLFAPFFAIAQAPFNGKLGYGISPAGFPNNTQQQAIDFYTEVSSNACGGTIMWGGSWFDSVQVAGTIPSSAHINAIATSAFPYEDINVFSFFNHPSTVWIQAPSNLNPNNFTNIAARDSFLNMLGKYASQDHPQNIFVGNEVDLYYEMDSLNFPAFASFYGMAYDTIKKYSPNTKVGTIFQHEHLSGQGVLAGWTQSYFEAIQLMDTSKMDQIGVTLYPFFNFQHSNQINSHYMDLLKNEIGNKEIVVTETGWPADQNFVSAPWTCSPQEQVDLIPILFDSLTPNINCHKMQWLFLNYLMSYDNTGHQIFRSVSMRDSLGNDRPAKALWDARCQAPTNINENTITNTYSFFPNPAAEEINIINTEHVPLKLTLLDVIGGTKANVKSMASEIKMNVREVPPGIYILIIESPSSTTKHKVTINK